jgi:hypothetical protein
MHILNQLRTWHRALLLTAFSIQVVTSCKPKSSKDLTLPSQPQKIEAGSARAPALKFENPQLKKLAEASDPDERTKLVLQLGEQKVVEAVPYLVANITVVKAPHVYNAMDWNKGYPCSTALAQIGDAAVPQIKIHFATSASNVDQLILLHTLVRIKGAQFVADWLETLKPKEHTSIGEDRLNELKNWVASQVQPSGVTVQQPTK